METIKKYKWWMLNFISITVVLVLINSMGIWPHTSWKFYAILTAVELKGFAMYRAGKRKVAVAQN